MGDHAGRAPPVGNRRPAVTELENASASQMQKRRVSERSPIPRFISLTSVLRSSGSAVNAVYGSRKGRAGRRRPRTALAWWHGPGSDDAAAGVRDSGTEQRRSRLSAVRRADDLDEGIVALPGMPLQGGLLRLTLRGWPGAGRSRTLEV